MTLDDKKDEQLRESFKAILRGHIDYSLCDENEINSLAEALDIEVMVDFLRGYNNGGS